MVQVPSDSRTRPTSTPFGCRGIACTPPARSPAPGPGPAAGAAPRRGRPYPIARRHRAGRRARASTPTPGASAMQASRRTTVRDHGRAWRRRLACVRVRAGCRVSGPVGSGQGSLGGRRAWMELGAYCSTFRFKVPRLPCQPRHAQPRLARPRLPSLPSQAAPFRSRPRFVHEATSTPNRPQPSALVFSGRPSQMPTPQPACPANAINCSRETSRVLYSTVTRSCHSA